MSVEPWERPTPYPVPRDVVDGWINALGGIMELAKIVEGSAFVPESYEDAGGAAAIAAAILTGREIGVGPMTALQHLHVIKGRPAMSAQLMRALVLAHGHHLRITVKTGVTATIIGRRLGESDEQEVTWTKDYAVQAGLWGRTDSWKRYPRAMLLARATGELCRDKFADVIGGMTLTIEEAGDVGEWSEPAAPAPRASRTMRRAPMVEAAPVAASVRPPSVSSAAAPVQVPGESTPPGPPDVAGEAPPLPVEEEPPEGHVNGQDPLPLPVDPPAPPAPEGPPEGPTGISSPQRAMLMSQLSALKLREPPKTRHHVYSGLIGRKITGTMQLTRDEAGIIIDVLARRLEEQLTPLQFEDLIAAGWAGIDG